MLQPLSVLYELLWRVRKLVRPRPEALRAPVLVVGNLVVGGAGKTPTVIALVECLRKAGWTPGVVSRGHGRRADRLCEVTPESDPLEVGDEPLLIHLRTRAHCVVGRQRRAAAALLLARHPEVDVVVSDDGLQHLALPRAVELVVFDDRGIGNGLLLPAGPLREPFTPSPDSMRIVLYNADQPSTSWDGFVAKRSLASRCRAIGTGGVQVQPLDAFRGRTVLAAAGIAVPERFFAALEGAGLSIERIPLPDHHDYAGALPWPDGAPEVLVTEKDAVKLSRRHGGLKGVWAVPLDLQLPDALVRTVLERLPSDHRQAPAGSQ